MNFPKNQLKIETMRGQGAGGQHRNKTDSMVRITHLPTGIVVQCDGRNQHANKRKALKELEKRLKEADAETRAAAKKAERDRKVASSRRVRTYDETANRVTDHRTQMRRQFNETVKGKTVQDFLDGYLADL